LITIVMPTYNRARTLRQAIDSVLRQTEEDWELIVVDDGSDDGTDEVLGALRDERIRVLRHAGNRGVTAALNTGLDHARGDWFTRLDSDDEIVPDALAVLLACADRMGADAVTCNCVDSVTGRLTGRGPAADGRLSARRAARCRGEFWGITATRLMDGLRFDERLPGYEDTVWLLVDHRARRYYLHRALRIYHTEGADRITVAGPRRTLTEKCRVFRALGEHRAYLRLLMRDDPAGYARLMVRVWAARLLRPLVTGGRRD